MKRGEDIDSLDDIKAFLQAQMALQKQKKTKGVKTDFKDNRFARGGNNSNKFYAFTENDNDQDIE